MMGFAWFYCLLPFLFLNCTFDYEKYSDRTETAKETPSIQILGISYHNVLGGKKQTILEALSFNYFNYYKLYKVDNGRFLHHVLKNRFSGKFNRLEGSHVTNDLDMKDSVELKVEDLDNYYLINTNRLLWKDGEKKLFSPPNELVSIRFDESNVIGHGFSYFLKSNNFYFYSGIEGFIK
ncbi:hypothetical protein baBA2_000460 [Borrelia anserina]|uniref:Uncharacterized protein n=2 Tax=Borrelia anserina TaxID=143 RepID=W5SMQ3_BORAN|nr:hypothetical protein [Borrelia anserina]AHH08444.1 Hypothetical protein BAN_0068500 [Borrelia anserina BA2]APR64920.1 hypothetical protein N187_02285 [Borrelia anserina Es]UPA06843.1 hypothetical protein baBA2_000460 [Borrelia anserina]